MPGTTTKEFEEFVKRQKSPAVREQAIDWDQERTDWIVHLDSLYKQIEAFLKKYKDEGSIGIDYKDIELNEEYIGRYIVRQMILHIGRQEITLTPVGTLLIGFKGRVDVAGSAGKARLALVDKDAVDARSMIRVRVTVGQRVPPEPQEEVKKKIDWVWKIASPPPVVRFVDLNAESFFQMIMEISNA